MHMNILLFFIIITHTIKWLYNFISPQSTLIRGPEVNLKIDSELRHQTHTHSYYYTIYYTRIIIIVLL